MFKWNRLLPVVFSLLFLVTSQKAFSQCPVATATPLDQTICSGSTNNAVIALSSDLGATTSFTWVTTQTNVTGGGNGSLAAPGNIVQSLTTNPLNVGGTVTYTITPTDGACTGASIVATILIHPKPKVVSNFLGNVNTICSGNPAGIGLTSTFAGTLLTWSVSAESNTSNATPGSGTDLVNIMDTLYSGVGGGTTTYNIVPTANGCTGLSIDFDVTVNQTPVVSFLDASGSPTGNSQTICSGNLSDLVVFDSDMPGNTYYTWESQPNLPSLSGYDTVGVFSDLHTNMYGIPPSQGEEMDTIPVQFITNSSSTAKTVTYSITVNGCPGPVTEYKITVDPSPKLLTIPFFQTICSGSSSAAFNLTSDLDPDVTYSWTSFVLNTSPGAGFLSGRSPTSDAGPTFTIPSQTLTTTSTTADTVIYTIKLTSTVAPFCSSFHQRWIIVKPLPNVISTPATADTICSDSTSLIVLSSNVADVFFDWTVDARGFAMGARDSTHVLPDINDTIQQTLHNPAFIADTAVYSIVATSADGCVGLTFLDSVFVDPTPDVTTPPTATVCADSTTLIELLSNVAGTTYSWSVSQSAGVSGAFNDSNDTIQQTLSNSNTTAGTVMYTIFPVANDCPGLPYVITVTVEPTPDVVATNAMDTICSDSTTLVVLTSTVIGTTYSWTVTQSAFVSGAFDDSNDSIEQVLTNTADTVGFAVYTITPNINGCPGIPIIDSIYVNPTPVVTSTVTAQTICSDSTTSIPLQSPVAGTTFNWTVSESVAMGASAGGGNDSILQTLTNPTTTAQTATYTIIPTAGGCPGAPFTVTVTVNPTPDVSGAPSTICSGDATNIVLTSLVAGTSYIWTVDQVGVSGGSAGFGASPITQTLTATGIVAGTATYSIIPTAGGCPGLPITIVVTVKPTPVVTATPPIDTICSNTATNIVLTSNLGGVTTYAWTASSVGATGEISPGSGSPITQTLTATGVIAGTTTYTIVPTNDGCVGTPVIDTVTVTPIPDVIATPAAQTICSGGSTGIVLTSLVAGTTFTWTVDQVGVSGASASAGTSITQTLTTTGAADGTATYTITPSVGGCTGTPVTVVITVKPVSVATPASTTICSGVAPNVLLTSPIVGTTFDWTQVPSNVLGSRDSTNVPNNGMIDQVLTASTTSVGTVVYTITPLATGCAGLPVLVTITVNPVPDVTPSSTALSICSGVTPNITLSPAVLGTVFDWTVVQTDVSGASAVSDTTGPIAQTLTSTSTVAGTAVYSITPEINGCPGTVVTSTVTVYPITTATPVNPTICTGTAPNVTLLSPVVGTTFDWTVTQTDVTGAYDTINSGFIDQALTLLPGASSGSVDYTISPSASGCAGTPIVVTVTVNPFEDPSFNYSSSTFCPAGIDPIPTITGLAGGTFKASPAGMVFISTTTGEIDLSASALNTYTVTYTTPGLCADSATFKITISNPPSAAFTYSQVSYCKNGVNPLPLFFPISSAGVFTATPGLIFANSFTGEIDLTASAPGTYTVTNTITCVTDINSSNSVVILPLDDATFNYESSTFCKTGADPTPIVSGLAGGTFSAAPAGLVFISTSTGEIDLSASALNTYTVTYTTSGSCVNTGTFGVTISNPPIATFSYPVAYCQNSSPNPTPTFPLGASAGVFTSQAGLVFANQFTGEIDLTASTPGTYTLTNTIPPCAGGVDFVATNTVTINGVDDASFNYSSSTFCQTGPDPTPIITGLAGGTFSASSPSLVFISTATGQIDLGASVLNVGAPYTITYTTSGICPSSATFGVTITNTSPPGAAFSYAGPYCTNVADPIPDYAPGNSGGVFTAPAGLVFANRFTGLIDLSASTVGTYTVTNTIDCAGALITSTNTVTVTAADDASFNYSFSTFCQSGTDPTPTITGLAGGIFTTSSPNLVLLSAATGKIDLSASVVGTYTVTYTNVGGTCPNSETFVVNITSRPSPDADFSYAGPYCQSSTPDASPTFPAGSFPGVFTSTPGLVFSDPFTGLVDLTASAQGTYTVTNTYDCSGVMIVATNTLTITMFPSFTVPANADACSGDSVIATSFVSIPTYTWVNSNPAIGLAASGVGNVPGFEATNPSAADISGVVTVTSTLNGCVGSVSSYTITVAPEVSADAGVDASLIVGASVTLGGSPTGTAGSTYVWSPSADFTDATYANPIAKPATTTLYSVIVTSGGCSATDSVLITVIPSFTPYGGLTPNGDGVNDIWDIDFLDFYPNNVVEIYNRWGELVFRSPGYTEKWDGRYKGKDLPVGTYYYIITLNDPKFPDAYTGPVTIMR